MSFKEVYKRVEKAAVQVKVLQTTCTDLDEVINLQSQYEDIDPNCSVRWNLQTDGKYSVVINYKQ